MTFLLAVLGMLQAGSGSAILDNAYAMVTKNAAPCARAATAGCGDRIIVALENVQLAGKKLSRGDVVVFQSTESYQPPVDGDYLEVVLKSNHPPVKSPPEMIAPEKNSLLYDGERFFIFEEKLPPGETRARHSHSQRVVVNLNATKLQQWPDGEPMVIKDQIPNNVHFNEPVIHAVKNVGDKPLRNLVIEFKPESKP